MNKHTYLLLLCVMLLCCSVRVASQVQETSNQTTIRFVALNKDGAFASTLAKDDFRVMEDGIPQTVAALERQSNVPVSLAFLIDTSNSQEKIIASTKAMSQTLITSVLRQGKDAAAVVAFTGRATLLQPLTSQLAKAQSAVNSLQVIPSPYENVRAANTNLPSPGSDQAALLSSAIWDAVWLTCEQGFQQSPANAKQAIILMSDGVNTYGQMKLTDAIERAIKAGVTVYAVGVGDNYNFDGVDKSVLRKLTERTGGKTFFPKKPADLQPIINELEQILHNNYLVNYSRSNVKAKGSYRKIKIELINPERKKEKIKLAYQDGYFQATR